ncbi:unnamed protein product [Taenia asiatica]|uniref:Integrase catalytic domain-containing protein n=1 Tax=Taenia asiatica TaxID=60517 RepID=A0A0R3W8D3_TAEAS|nr:unnamed protein product [Taenia asiatica]
MGPLPLTKRGNCYILVMVDYFTKVAKAEPTKSQDAEAAALIFFNRWICQHGVPESFRSDQGPNFKSRLIIELCKTFGIAKTRKTPGHPQGNGQVEGTNRTLIGLLKAFTKLVQSEDRNLSLLGRYIEYFHDIKRFLANNVASMIIPAIVWDLCRSHQTAQTTQVK